MPPKWIGRFSPLPLGDILQRILHPLDFFFSGYTKCAVPQLSIILPKLSPRIQAADTAVPPVMLINVRAELESRYLCRAAHCALLEHLYTGKRRSQNFITHPTKMRYFSLLFLFVLEEYNIKVVYLSCVHFLS